MVKKAVPDWLNSSLWSSPAPPPPPSPPPPPPPAASAVKPTIDPPVPVLSPSAARASEPPPSAANTAKGEIRDPLGGGHYGNNSSVHYSDDETGSSSANSMASPAAALPPAAQDVSRRAQILQELSKKTVNIGELRKLASQGIPDGAGIRATVWKLLLGYLPADRSLWPSELAKKRSQYRSFKEELLMSPSVRDYQEAGGVKS